MGTQCFRLTLEDDEEEKNPESLSFVNTKDDDMVRHTSKTKYNDDETVFKKERNNLQTSARPLLISMKLFGIYFSNKYVDDNVKEQQFDCANEQTIQRPNTPKIDVKSGEMNYARIPSIIALVLLWFNVARCTTAFTSSDTFDTIFIYKVTMAAIDCLCAIMHTSYHVACRDGKLDLIMKRITLTDRQAKIFRGLAIVFSIFLWLAIGVDVFLLVYVDYFSHYRPGFLLAPLQTYIPVSDAHFPVLVALAVVRVTYTLPYCLFPVALNQIISLGLYLEFRTFNRRFKEAIDDSTGRFNGNVRQFRHRHQALSHSVEDADHFIRIGNVGGFVCHMVMVIFLLYSVIFNEFTDAAVFYTCVICLAFNDMFLTMATMDGITINHEAHKLSDTIHDIDLALLNQSEVGELNMFQKRLSGNPIGFSVLGIFVINKSTVLSIIGLLITYFLLVVQMSSSPSSETNKVLCGNFSSV